MAAKERLDKLVTGQRLIRSRSKAQRMIMAGRVKVDGQIVYRPGHMIDPLAQIELVSKERYVSRGGDKLEAALIEFRVDPTGRTCLDVGSATGGFTDCLLQHGAKAVHCVDVGQGLLDWRLRNDPRVIVHEGLNARFLDRKDLGEEVDLVTVDVAFISLRVVLPAVLSVVGFPGEAVLLVKPQFEAGKDKVGRGGVVRDAGIHLEVLEAIHQAIADGLAWSVVGATHSPLLGPAGNMEFFFHVRPGSTGNQGGARPDLAAVVERAHALLVATGEKTGESAD